MSSKIQGNLKIMSLPDVLQWISLAQKSGSLIFERGKEKKVLFFSKGTVIGANSNSPKDKIGEILIRMDKLKPEVLEQGLRTQKETGELIGDVFLAKELFTSQEFVAALERQATQIIYDLFSWREGEFIFQERLPKARTIPISIKVDFILMEGMRRVDEWHRVRDAFPTLDILVDWVPGASEEQRVEEEEAIAKLINGKNTLLDICDQSPLNDFDTCNFLFRLFSAQKIVKQGVRSPHEILQEDDVKRLLIRGKAFYQKGDYGDAIPFFERVLKLEPESKEADRFLTRSITSVQNELLHSLGSPNAVLEISKGFRLQDAQDLTAAEGFILSRIDGMSSAKEVSLMSGLSQTDACIHLNRLFEKGIIRAGREKEQGRKRVKPPAEREFLDPKKKQMTLDLGETSLSEILLDLIKQRKTGILQLISAPMDIRAYFQDGDLVFATSNMESDRSGSILLRKKKITEEQYEQVRSLSDKDNLLQGNALVKLGLISPNDLIWLTKTKVEEILFALFGWRKGKARFFEMEMEGLDIIHLKLAPGRIILEGTWRYYEEEEILSAFGSRDALFEPVATPPLSRRDLDLSHTEMEILTHLNGRISMSEIASLMNFQPLEVMKVIFGFYCLGIVRMSGRLEKEAERAIDRTCLELNEAWEELQKKNCYEIFELDKDAEARNIQKQFFLFSKRYHPDKSFRFSNQEILDVMLKIFLAGKEAYEILSDPERRTEYNHFLSEQGEQKSVADFQEYIKPNVEVGHILQAEEYFNRAKALLYSGRSGDALEFFEKALELVPDDPDYNAYTGLSLARMKADYEKAVELIQKALDADAQNADYYAFLGEAHLRHGKKTKARKAFGVALEINPRHIQARREHQRLASEGE